MLGRPLGDGDNAGEGGEPESAGFIVHAHRNGEVWTWACAVAIAAELRRELALRPRARLLVGTGTPAPVYRALARAPLDWARVDISLTDELWLLPDDPDSHARAIRGQLLLQHAAVARFEPLTRPGRRLEDAVATANAHAHDGASVAVLEMGDDGRVAALFPGMHELDRLLASRQSYAAIDASDCPQALPWRRRIGLTPAGLARVRHRLLLLRGQRQRALFEQACAARSGNARAWPVLAAVGDGAGAPLQVHWCA